MWHFSCGLTNGGVPRCPHEPKNNNTGSNQWSSKASLTISGWWDSDEVNDLVPTLENWVAAVSFKVLKFETLRLFWHFDTALCHCWYIRCLGSAFFRKVKWRYSWADQILCFQWKCPLSCWIKIILSRLSEDSFTTVLPSWAFSHFQSQSYHKTLSD